MTPITVTLPWPDAALSPNARNRYARMAAVTLARAEAYTLALEARPAYITQDIPLVVKWDFYPPDRRHRDIDNLISMCKAFQDGVFDAIGVNDHSINRIEADRCGVVAGGKVVITIDKETK
jgi:crossover junction endodeoxyribonuclease RusA